MCISKAQPVNVAVRQLPIAILAFLFSTTVHAQDTDSAPAAADEDTASQTEADTDTTSEQEAADDTSQPEATDDTDTAPTAEITEPAPEAPPPAPEVHWYTHINGQNQGPFTQAEMEKMVTTGMITHNAKVNKAGTPDWVAAHTMFQFQTPPPPAAPPATTAAPLPTDNTRYLKSKARHVRAGNIMAGIGMLGSAPGLALQIKAIKDEDLDLALSGMGLAVGFGGLRFAGVLVSGIAARKYTRMQGNEADFSWGAFWGGIAAGAAGTIIQYALGGNEEVDEIDDSNVNAIIATAIATEVLRDLFWILHCLKAKSATEAHRNVAIAPHRPQLAIAPLIQPRTGSYGLSLGLNY